MEERERERERERLVNERDEMNGCVLTGTRSPRVKTTSKLPHDSRVNSVKQNKTQRTHARTTSMHARRHACKPCMTATGSSQRFPWLVHTTPHDHCICMGWMTGARSSHHVDVSHQHELKHQHRQRMLHRHPINVMRDINTHASMHPINMHCSSGGV